MAPKDLLTPLLGQREETLKVLASLSEADLDRVHEETGWSVRNIIGHIASAEMGEAFFIRMAAEGELIHMDQGSRDTFNHDPSARLVGCSRVSAGILKRTSTSKLVSMPK